MKMNFILSICYINVTMFGFYPLMLSLEYISFNFELIDLMVDIWA